MPSSKARLAIPHGAGGDVDAADLDAVHHLVEALAGLATQDLLGRDLVVLEDGLGGVDALVAHLVDLARDGQPGAVSPKPGSFSTRKVVMFL